MRYYSYGDIWGNLILIAYFIVGIVGAIAVYRDAERQTDLFLKLHPGWWGLVALVTNVLGVATYWLIHHSTLRQSYAESADEE